DPRVCNRGAQHAVQHLDEARAEKSNEGRTGTLQARSSAGPIAFTEYSVNTCAATVGWLYGMAQSLMGMHRRPAFHFAAIATNALERTAATNLNGDVRNGYESQGN